MNSTLSSARSWLSASHWQSKLSNDATLVPDDPSVSIGTKDDGLPIKWPLLGTQTLRVIAFLITVCVVVAAALAWQSSRQTTASIPQTAPVSPSPNSEQQLETISLSLRALGQSVDEIAASIGQMRRDITNLQTSEQALFDKISEPPPTAGRRATRQAHTAAVPRTDPGALTINSSATGNRGRHFRSPAYHGDA
jgi:hypothetical protein